jgi:hypothetical protein
VYRAGFLAGTSARKNPARDITDVLAQLERTKLFKDAAAGDLALVREFYLAGYHDGMGEKGNPGVFAKCVKAVTAKGGAVDPRAVCAAAGRKKLGQAEMTRRAKAGEKRAAGNPPVTEARERAATLRAQHAQTDLARARTRWGYDSPQAKAALRKWERASDVAWGLRKKLKAKRNPRNPLDTSEDAYAGFHGEKPKGAVVVQERSHFHTHVWSIGKLVYLRIQLPPDRREVGLSNIVELEFDYETAKPAFLTANEKRTQMFIDGGDQSVDLKTFGIDTRTAHEKELLGYLKNFGYFTDKKHLGSEGGRAIYKHKVGDEGGELPAVVYRVLDRKIEIVGGSYTIPNEGVRN